MNAIGHLGQLIINLQSPIEILLLIALVAIVAVWLYKRLRGGGKQAKILEEINAKVSTDGRQEKMLEEINAKIAELDSKVNAMNSMAQTKETVSSDTSISETSDNELSKKEISNSEAERREVPSGVLIWEETSRDEALRGEISNTVELEKKIDKLIESINQCRVESKTIHWEASDMEVKPTPVETVEPTEELPTQPITETETDIQSESTEEVPAQPITETETDIQSESTEELPTQPITEKETELTEQPKKKGGLDIALMEELERAAGGTVEEILIKSMPSSREADEASKQVPKTQQASIDASTINNREDEVESEAGVEKITRPTEKEPPLVKIETGTEATVKGVIEQILQTEKPAVAEPAKTAPARTFVSRDAAVDKHGNVYTEEMLMSQIG